MYITTYDILVGMGRNIKMHLIYVKYLPTLLIIYISNM